jgi:TolB-like protein/tetratricopeptide (TPR) repeat protein
MSADKLQPPAGLREPRDSERLDSWKRIAAYLKRDESTVRRWEKEGLPVHRHAHKNKATIYAYTSEIDAWWNVGRLPGRPVAGEINSIAVLPLKNLSGDPGQDYFADGMTEALITELGKISSLRVLSYQSVMGYRQSAKPSSEMAQELKVDALLEGAVVSRGDRVRITVNLVGAVRQRHLWAETYEFDSRDVVAVQGKVGRDVARQVLVRLTPQVQARLTTDRRVNTEAYEAYLLGRAYFNKIPSGWKRAKDYFEQAIAKDPGYAPAYAGLALAYARIRGPLTRDPTADRVQARQWAEKALKLDDTLAEAHTALARLAQNDYDWAGSEREYRRAIELNPSYSLARIWYAQYLYAMRRFEEAVTQAQVAQQLDPGSLFVNTRAGAAYFLAGRVEVAMATWQRAQELDPTDPDVGILPGRSYVKLGMYQDAVAVLEKSLILSDRDPLVLGALAHAYARAGRREEALKLVGALKLMDERLEPEGKTTPRFSFIWAYAGLGDREQAFAWLEKAYQERRGRVFLLNVDPLLDPLRSDPRFQDLVRRVGLDSK